MSDNNDLKTIINEGYGEYDAQTPVKIEQLDKLICSWFPNEKNLIALKRNAGKLIRQLKAYYARHADEDGTIALALENVAKLIEATQLKSTPSSSGSSNSDDSDDNIQLPSNRYDSDSHSTSSASVSYGSLIRDVKDSAKTFSKRQSGKFIAGILNVIASIALNIAALAVLAVSGGTLVIPAIGLAAGGAVLGATGLGLLFSSKRIGKTLDKIAHQSGVKNKQK